MLAGHEDVQPDDWLWFHFAPGVYETCDLDFDHNAAYAEILGTGKLLPL